MVNVFELLLLTFVSIYNHLIVVLTHVVCPHRSNNLYSTFSHRTFSQYDNFWRIYWYKKFIRSICVIFLKTKTLMPHLSFSVLFKQLFVQNAVNWISFSNCSIGIQYEELAYWRYQWRPRTEPVYLQDVSHCHPHQQTEKHCMVWWPLPLWNLHLKCKFQI